MCIIKFCTHKCNEIYDVTNNLKIIISIRGGGNLLFWELLVDILEFDILTQILLIHLTFVALPIFQEVRICGRWFLFGMSYD